jgi:hypothetical protein
MTCQIYFTKQESHFSIEVLHKAWSHYSGFVTLLCDFHSDYDFGKWLSSIMLAPVKIVQQSRKTAQVDLQALKCGIVPWSRMLISI